MPSLKEFRNRIASVKSTRKITSAMKLVAASKLRRAQTKAEAAQPYAQSMSKMMEHMIDAIHDMEDRPFLMKGTGSHKSQLLILVTSDRGLCGGFNSAIIRKICGIISTLMMTGKTVKLICVGRKGATAMNRMYPGMVLETLPGPGGKEFGFHTAQRITDLVLSMAEDHAFDVCSIVYNAFQNVMTQVPTSYQLVPLKGTPDEQGSAFAELEEEYDDGEHESYIVEPDPRILLETLLPRNVSVQIYRALLDSAAGEQAARMTAMDSATRNAGDMIDKLTLKYNRARQAYITKELIEIISGAEAV